MVRLHIVTTIASNESASMDQNRKLVLRLMRLNGDEAKESPTFTRVLHHSYYWLKDSMLFWRVLGCPLSVPGKLNKNKMIELNVSGSRMTE